MSDKPGRDTRGRPGLGTARQPRQPAQQQPQPDDGSQSIGSASGAQSPPRPATGPALRGTNVNTGSSSIGPSSSGFRAARPVQGGKPQPSVAFSTRNRPQQQPQNQTGADAASSTSLAGDDGDDAGQTTTATTTTTVPQPTAKPAQTDGIATHPRTGLGPGRAANPIPMMARGRAQVRDRREDEAASDADVENKDADLDTLVRDPGSEADDESDTSSESSEAKQPATKVPSGRQQPDDSTTTTTTTTTTPINTQAPTQSISTDDSTTTTTATTPIDTQAPTQSISTSTEAKSTGQDPRRAAFQQQRRVAAKVLAPDKRAWGNDLAKVLRLPIPSSQTRLLNEGLATAGQIAGSNAYSQQDKQAASRHCARPATRPGTPTWPCRPRTRRCSSTCSAFRRTIASCRHSAPT